MAVQSTTIEHFIDTTAKLRAWGAAVAAAFDAVGFTRTTDTGQIDWTTITLPGTGTPIGYEVRKFTDPIQTTKPIIVRVNYARSSLAGGDTAGISQSLVVGVASDGAGIITAPNWIVGYLSTQAGGSTANFRWSEGLLTGQTRTIWASGEMASTGARVGWVLGADPNADGHGHSYGFFIQRTVDVSGAPTDDGFFVLGIAPIDSNPHLSDENFYDFDDSQWRGGSYFLNNPTTASATVGVLQMVPVPGIAARGSTVYTLPWNAIGRNRAEHPLPDWILYHWSQRPRSAEDFTITRHAASRTFRPTGLPVKTGLSGALRYDFRLAIRWD